MMNDEAILSGITGPATYRATKPAPARPVAFVYSPCRRPTNLELYGVDGPVRKPPVRRRYLTHQEIA